MRFKTASAAFKTQGMAAETATAVIGAGRLFGLDAGDWSMIAVGLALSAVLLILV